MLVKFLSCATAWDTAAMSGNAMFFMGTIDATTQFVVTWHDDIPHLTK